MSPAAGFPGLVVTCAAGQRRDEGSNPGRVSPDIWLATSSITSLAPLHGADSKNLCPSGAGVAPRPGVSVGLEPTCTDFSSAVLPLDQLTADAGQFGPKPCSQASSRRNSRGGAVVGLRPTLHPLVLPYLRYRGLLSIARWTASRRSCSLISPVTLMVMTCCCGSFG